MKYASTVIVILCLLTGIQLGYGSEPNRDIEINLRVDATYPNGLRGSISDGSSFALDLVHGTIIDGPYQGELVRLVINDKKIMSSIAEGNVLKLRLSLKVLEQHFKDTKDPAFAYVHIYDDDYVLIKVNPQANQSTVKTVRAN